METTNKIFSLTEEMLDELAKDIFEQCDFHYGSDEMYHFNTDKVFDDVRVQIVGWVYYSMSKSSFNDDPEVIVNNINIQALSVKHTDGGDIKTLFDRISLENELLKRINN